MNKFFSALADVNPKLKDDWGQTLDWLVNDNKFDGWTRNEIGNLTKKIKRLDGFANGKTYVYDAAKNIDFSSYPKKTIQAIFAKGDTEGRDFIRHMRNGIAHGQAKCFRKSGEIFIEIIDYLDDSHTKQTAYMYFPISYIIKVHELYGEVKKAKSRDKKSKRR